MIFEKRILRNSSSAILIQVWGSIEDGETFDESVLSQGDIILGTSLRLTDVAFTIQDGLSIILFWEGVDDHTLLMPLEARGRLTYDWCGGLVDPRKDGWTGGVVIHAEPFKPGHKHFSLVLEFAKVN